MTIGSEITINPKLFGFQKGTLNIPGFCEVGFPIQDEGGKLIREAESECMLRVCGGRYCIGPNTRITNADTSEQVAVKDIHQPMPVWAMAEDGQVVRVMAETPFIKGYAQLYRVVLEDGQSFEATDQHRLLTPQGWRQLRELSVGSPVAVASRLRPFVADHLLSTADSGLPVLPSDALHLSSTTPGWQDHYSVGSYPCDAQPRKVADTGPVDSPSLNDVLGHTQSEWHKDGLVHKYTDTHCQSCDLPARCGTSRLPLDSRWGCGEYPSQPSSHAQVHHLSAIPAPSCSSLRDDAQLATSSSHRHSRTMSVSASPAFPYPTSTSSLHNYITGWCLVASITATTVGDYYDLCVPVHHNYLAEGVFHHNSAKTYASLIRGGKYALYYPGSWGMIITLTKSGWRANIIPKFNKLLNDWGLRFGRHYDFNKNDGEYTFYNGSKIFLRTSQEPENLPGPDMAWMHIDEFRAMPESVFTETLPTVRQYGYPHQVWMSSTPGGAMHWSRRIWMPREYARDFDVAVAPQRAGHYINFTAHTKDNPYLAPQLYRMWVEQFGGEHTRQGRQELFGEELIMDGLVYEGWDSLKFMVPPDKWPSQPNTVVAGVDFGFKHPAAIVVYGIDEANRRYVMDEFHQTHCDAIAIATVAKELQERYNIERFVCDSEDPAAIHVMRRDPFNLPASGAQKILRGSADKSSTFGLVDRAINQQIEGGQGFFVHPQCKNFRRQIEGYVYDKDPRYRDGPEVPRKRNDDIMDALRYAEIWVATKLIGRSASRGASMLDWRMAA